MKFILIAESEDFKLTYETDTPLLDDALEAFEDFLRGAGFCFKGKLEIVRDKPDHEY